MNDISSLCIFRNKSATRYRGAASGKSLSTGCIVRRVSRSGAETEPYRVERDVGY